MQQTARKLVENTIRIWREHLEENLLNQTKYVSETGNGIVAHATVNSSPKKEKRQEIRNPESYPWIFSLKDPELYLDNSIIIDKSLRSKLDAFKGKDLNKLWAWFVQSTRKITEHDYGLLTR